jgi:hypothetical protein
MIEVLEIITFLLDDPEGSIYNYFEELVLFYYFPKKTAL